MMMTIMMMIDHQDKGRKQHWDDEEDQEKLLWSRGQYQPGQSKRKRLQGGIQGSVGKVSQMDWEGLLILNMGVLFKSCIIKDVTRC